jgi:hypothetical protein
MQEFPAGKFHGVPSQEYGDIHRPRAVALAAKRNGFQIGNARQPMTQSLPLKNGLRHVPAWQLRLSGYLSFSLMRKGGDWSLLAHRDLASRIHVCSAP